ncbi:MAG: cytochrome oxidase subunit III [Bacteroidetes bacterium]|nr:MAG: cytochrome oxidase subunit III [Bacteroidota bacterium]
METDAMTYQGRNRIHPQTFALWAAMASILMMFGAFTSAYLVRQAAGNWQEYQVPEIFYISTIVLLASSACVHYAFAAFKNGEKNKYQVTLTITLVLGIAFIVLQYYGWNALYNIGVPLDGNPSGSFFYVISGIHALHILGGITALVVAVFHAFSLPFEVTAKRKHRFSLVTQYWHFVDVLWLYLFVFILIAR